MFNLKLVSLISSSVGLFSFFAATQSSAITFYTKPDFPVNSAEFGHNLAKKGKYTVIGADRHAEFGRQSFVPDDWGTQRNPDNGAIYVITDDNSEPVRKYQFLKDPTVAPTNANGQYLAIPLNFGSNVAISDNWIAATVQRHGLLMQPSIALIPKANGTFPTCPTAPYITGIPGSPSTQKNWGNAVDCTSVTDVPGGVTKPIRVLTLPSTYTGSLGRTLLLKLSDSALAISNGNTVIGAHRIAPTGQWQTTFSFAADSGKRISDIALNGDYLAISVTSTEPAIKYIDDNGIVEQSDFVYNNTPGEIHTYKLTENTATSTGILTGGFAGYGSRLAMNGDTLLVSAGIGLYPPELLTLNPNLALSSPVPKGYIYQYRLNPSNNTWNDRGYGEYSSTPTQLKLDNDVFAVQLQEMGMTQLGSGTGYSPVYNPGSVAKIYSRGTSGEKLFEHGHMTLGKTVSKNQIDSARPWYAYVNTPNQFVAGFPIDIANGSIVFGWKAVRGDNTETYALNGGIFNLKLNEIW